ncbi:MAG: hypothetical protein FJZ43_03895 [Candidatus Staskawiczbacteria bacterium]|nr:hypothetical protein [Candidatus Staskawiczbacteria bacterium]
MNVKKEVYYVLAFAIIVFVALFVFGKDIGFSPKEDKKSVSSENVLKENIIFSFKLGSLDQSKNGKEINTLSNYFKQFSGSVPTEEYGNKLIDSSSNEVEFPNEVLYDEKGLPQMRVITGAEK